MGAAENTERSWWTLVAVCAATFMLLVDVTIVQVALPTIQRHLHSSFSDLEWVIDAYALSLASILLTCGALADRFGRKRIFLAGLVIFTLASLLCGVAQSSVFLIWARAVQGLGGGAMFATGLALIGQDYHGPDRGRAIAAWGATVGAAVAIGPLVGGALTDSLGWRWIFFVNVPIGIVTVALGAARMRNISDPAAVRLDIAGLVTFAGSLFLLILGLLRGNDDGWGSGLIVGLLVASALLMVTFVLVELRQARPMFDLTLFRKPGFVGVSLATFAIGGGMFAMYPYITLYLQNDLGYSPLAGGARLLPSTVLCFIVPLATRSVVERFPPGAVLGFGMAITAAGIGLMLGLSTGLHVDAPHPRAAAHRLWHRHRQSRHRQDRPRCGGAAAKRHGVGHQQHVSDRRARDRRGRAGRGLPAPARGRALRAQGPRRARIGARQDHRLGRHPRGRCERSARLGHRGGLPPRVRLGDERAAWPSARSPCSWARSAASRSSGDETFTPLRRPAAEE